MAYFGGAEPSSSNSSNNPAMCVARRRCCPQGADQGQDYYEERCRERVMRALSQRAAKALSNAWLKAHGLVSVKELWCKAPGYTT